jgi:hypothetical protein
MKIISPLASLAVDAGVMDELHELLSSRRPFHCEGAMKRAELMAAKRLQHVLMSRMPDEANSEALVQATGHPSLLVRSGQYEELELETWRERLRAHRDVLAKSIQAFAPVEVSNHPDFVRLGTG